MSKKLYKSLKAQKDQTEQVKLTIYGSLGIFLGGEKVVQVANRQGYVYVRLRENQNEIIQAFNNRVASSYGLPVIVVREGGRYVVQQYNSQRYLNNALNPTPFLPGHGTQHSFPRGGGADITWVYGQQIIPALVYPSPTTGTNVYIDRYPLYTPDNRWIYAGGTGTQNILQYLPTTGSSSLMVLVYMDAYTGNPGILVGSGTYFPANVSGSIYQYIPSPSVNQIPLAGVLLNTGTTTILWSNIYDVRQWVHATPSGTSSGGGGSGIDTIGFVGQSNGAYLATGTVLNVVGAGATFTVSGTTFNLNIPGGGTSTPTYPAIYDDSVFKVTGTSISFDGGLKVVSTGTTAYVYQYPIPNSVGGRLSLVTGTPVTSTDVTGSSSLYYVPYTHDTVILWDGAVWNPYVTAGATLALGSLTTGTGYDVFGYLSTGTMALEKLAWSNSVSRATPITAQDGRYCKSGDKSRLYLGSFYPSSTTTTEDSLIQRYVWNMYNRIPRELEVVEGTAHNYNIATVRAWNNVQSAADFEWFLGLAMDTVLIAPYAQITRAALDGNPRSRFGLNSTTTEKGLVGIATATLVGRITGGGTEIVAPSLGYSFACMLEFSTVGTAPGTTFESASMSGVVMA